jgi:hypothetical protein
MKPHSPILQSTRILNQARRGIIYIHYSLSAEKTYFYWNRCYSETCQNAIFMIAAQATNTTAIGIFMG